MADLHIFGSKELSIGGELNERCGRVLQLSI